MHILKYGFTLAEVLITLLIVGVISSIVIPGIIQDSQDAELKTAWKKAYAEVSQALIKLRQDNGGTYRDFFPYFTLKPEFIKYFNVTKDCGNNTTGCFNIPAFNYKSLSGDAVAPALFDEGQFILNSGMFIMVQNLGPAYFVTIWVDVNGYRKKPNVIGKDVFGIEVFESSFKPLGSIGTAVDVYGSVEDTCNTTSGTRSGMGCSALYLTQ
jgi:prepilin-type N-terminal cleavage/methylation domain-containing protein